LFSPGVCKQNKDTEVGGMEQLSYPYCTFITQGSGTYLYSLSEGGDEDVERCTVQNKDNQLHAM